MSGERELALSMTRWRWRHLTRMLAERGRGERESGAFLLGPADVGAKRVTRHIPFDDLDPQALNGTIEIRGEAFNELWNICRRDGLRVIGDVHTHPGSGVAQSFTDRTNPMVAQRGHVALILPHFAAGRPRVADAGLHIYNGDQRWSSYFELEAQQRLELRWW